VTDCVLSAQVAFCVQNVVPGIGFSDDPLLQGRLFSYVDTQLTRLGGPNFNSTPRPAFLAIRAFILLCVGVSLSHYPCV